jgi:hypothetical protein
MVSVKHNNILFYFNLDDLFRHFIIRPFLQNLEQYPCSTNNIHVIWDPIKLTNLLTYIKNGVRLTVF